jgi:hypothetical protein
MFKVQDYCTVASCELGVTEYEFSYSFQKLNG